MGWGFYGRGAELRELEAILRRKRWFFARITGRRRIGKTALIQRALAAVGASKVLYAQIPDSAPTASSQPWLTPWTRSGSSRLGSRAPRA